MVTSVKSATVPESGDSTRRRKPALAPALLIAQAAAPRVDVPAAHPVFSSPALEAHRDD